MIEITRTEPYPERYAATSEMVQEEQRVNARPLFTLSGDVDALDSSDTVFLGYPIWCGDMPMPVYAFLESRDWSGKTIYPFCTHGGSGLGRTPERIAAITKTTVKPGLAVMGTDAQNNASKAAEAVSGDRQIRSIDSQSTSVRSVCFSTPSSWSRRILVSMPPA